MCTKQILNKLNIYKHVQIVLLLQEVQVEGEAGGPLKAERTLTP